MSEASYGSLELLFRPAPLLVYKPARDVAKGNAMKVELNLRPEYLNGYLTSKVEGGLFMQIVGQTGVDQHANASFDWKGTKGTSVSAKLGLPDLHAILYCFKVVRERGGEVPTNFRGKQHPQPDTLEIFHRFEKSTTVIRVTFKEQGTIWNISKGPELRRSIAVAVHEEVSLLAYLEHSLKMFLMVGER